MQVRSELSGKMQPMLLRTDLTGPKETRAAGGWPRSGENTNWLVHRADADKRKRKLHPGLYEICHIVRSGLCILHPTGLHEFFGGSS